VYVLQALLEIYVRKKRIQRFGSLRWKSFVRKAAVVDWP
jgi:hypothetical protein